MKTIFQTFEKKLCQNRLTTDKSPPLLGISDQSVLWNIEKEDCKIIEKIFEHPNIRAILFSQPAEPYHTIINYLAETSDGKILPQDCETRHFLYDLPVLSDLTSYGCKTTLHSAVIPILTNRKSIIFPGHGILTCSPSGIEQTYVTFSSVCFACFIKFFSDFLFDAKQGNLTPKQISVFHQVLGFLESFPEPRGSLIQGPFESETQIHAALEEAGRLTVEYRLVDSCFGNISYAHNNMLYISKTGSFLDNLKGYIVPCPVHEDLPCKDASSELPAHRRIIKDTENKAILHGHPMFSVILSMDCDVKDCEYRGECHLRCSQERFACEIPIVPGEVGGGTCGLCNTVPHAIKNRDGVIVFGHGVFTTGKIDFNKPFSQLLEIERSCRKEYFNRVRQADSQLIFDSNKI